jgi:hypothetical protein
MLGDERMELGVYLILIAIKSSKIEALGSPIHLLDYFGQKLERTIFEKTTSSQLTTPSLLIFEMKFILFFFFLKVGPAIGLFLMYLGNFFKFNSNVFYNTEFLSIHVRWHHFEVDESNPVSLSISSSLLSISSSLLSISSSLLSISSAQS